MTPAPEETTAQAVERATGIWFGTGKNTPPLPSPSPSSPPLCYLQITLFSQVDNIKARIITKIMIPQRPQKRVEALKDH